MKKQSHKTTSILLLLCMAWQTMTLVTSCDDEWTDDRCNCKHGDNGIGGWGDQDTTDVNRNDILGGFDVSVSGWGEREKHDISL